MSEYLWSEYVEPGFSNLIVEMDKLRDDTIKEAKHSYVRNEDYKHLTYNLASLMLQMGKRDNRLASIVNNIARELLNDKSLFYYDPCQDASWMNMKKTFLYSLNVLSLKLFKDIIPGYKHHLFQAIKYLTGKELDLESRLELQDSIKPFIGGLRKDFSNYYYGVKGVLLLESKGAALVYYDDFTAFCQYPNESMLKNASNCGFIKMIKFSNSKISDEHYTLIDSSNYLYIYSCRIDSEKTNPKSPNLARRLLENYSAFGSIVNKILTEPVYDDSKIPKNNPVELKKNEVFNANPGFFNEHNAKYELPIIVDCVEDCIKHVLFANNSNILYLITSEDSKIECSSKDISHLLNNNDDNDFIKKRLFKLVPELLYYKLFKLDSRLIFLYEDIV